MVIDMPPWLHTLPTLSSQGRCQGCWDLSEKVSCSKRLFKYTVFSELPAVCPAQLGMALSVSTFQVCEARLPVSTR